jgi:hypothetical protein
MEMYTGTQISDRYRSNVEFIAIAFSALPVSNIHIRYKFLCTAFAVGFSQASVI